MIADANQQIYYKQPYYEKGSLPLNITNRFSSQIAKPLNNIFKGNLETANFTRFEMPLLYAYETPKDIIEFLSFSRRGLEYLGKT